MTFLPALVTGKRAGHHNGTQDRRGTRIDAGSAGAHAFASRRAASAKRAQRLVGTPAYNRQRPRDATLIALPYPEPQSA